MKNNFKLVLSIVTAFSFVGCIFGTLAYLKVYDLNKIFGLSICVLVTLLYFVVLYLINKED